MYLLCDFGIKINPQMSEKQRQFVLLNLTKPKKDAAVAYRAKRFLNLEPLKTPVSKSEGEKLGLKPDLFGNYQTDIQLKLNRLKTTKSLKENPMKPVKTKKKKLSENDRFKPVKNYI